MAVGYKKTLIDGVAVEDVIDHYSEVHSLDEGRPRIRAHFSFVNGHDQDCTVQFEGSEDAAFTDPYNLGESMAVTKKVGDVKGTARAQLTNPVPHVRVLYSFAIQPSAAGDLTCKLVEVQETF